MTANAISGLVPGAVWGKVPIVKTFTYKCGSGIVPRLSKGTRLGPDMCMKCKSLGDLTSSCLRTWC